MKLNIALIAPLAPIALLATPLAAQTNQADVPSVTIDVSDLDLAKPEGTERLDTRIQMQIRRMCAVSDRSLAAKKLERTCRETALAQAEPKVRLAVRQARLQTLRLASAKPVAAGE